MHRIQRLLSSVLRTHRFRIPILGVSVLMVLLLFLLLFRGCSTGHESDNAQTESTAPLQIIEQFATKNECYISGRSITVRGLMLHSVGTAQPSAKAYANSFNKARPGGREVCPHAFLQADGTVYQVLPWEMYGWHAGGTLNQTHIGIEMCEPASLVYTGPCTFYAEDPDTAKAEVTRTYRAAVELFAELCVRYGLDPLEEGVILSHTEGAAQNGASNHSDPEHLWTGLGLPYTMDTFRSDVHTRITEMQ